MRDYHKDALDRYNVTCDFPNVIRELIDPHKRFPFQVGTSLLARALQLQQTRSWSLETPTRTHQTDTV